MITAFDFISLFCNFSDWESNFFIWYGDDEDDLIPVDSITESGAKRMVVKSAKIVLDDDGYFFHIELVIFDF